MDVCLIKYSERYNKNDGCFIDDGYFGVQFTLNPHQILSQENPKEKIDMLYHGLCSLCTALEIGLGGIPPILDRRDGKVQMSLGGLSSARNNGNPTDAIKEIIEKDETRYLIVSPLCYSRGKRGQEATLFDIKFNYK